MVTFSMSGSIALPQCEETIPEIAKNFGAGPSDLTGDAGQARARATTSAWTGWSNTAMIWRYGPM